MDKKISEYKISFLTKTENSDAIRNVMLKRGIEIVSESEPVKVHLAYPVKKEQYAFSGSFLFRAPSDDVTEITPSLKLEKDILRLMIIKEPILDVDARTHQANASLRARVRRRGDGVKRSFKTELSNEALEKKIEEILQ